MTLFLPGSKDPAGIQTQKLFPFFIVLAKLVSSKTTAEVGVSTSDIIRLIFT